VRAGTQLLLHRAPAIPLSNTPTANILMLSGNINGAGPYKTIATVIIMQPKRTKTSKFLFSSLNLFKKNDVKANARVSMENIRAIWY